MRKFRRDLPSAPKMYRTGISGFELGLAHHYASVVPDTTSLPQNNYTLLCENREKQEEIAAVFRKQGVPGSHPVAAPNFIVERQQYPAGDLRDPALKTKKGNAFRIPLFSLPEFLSWI